MRKRLLFTLFISATLLAISGCGHVCRRFSCGRCSTPEPPLPAANRPLAPQPGSPYPQAAAPQDSIDPFDPLEPQPIPDSAGGQNRFPSLPGGAGANDRIPPESESRSVPRVDLLPPRDLDKPKVKEEVEQNSNVKPMPPADEGKGPDVSFFSADVPSFFRVKPGVYSGEKPFAAGLTWLKDKGFVAVLHVHAPDESVDAVRRNFEAKGIRYESLAVAPEQLDRALVDKFNQIVTNKDNHPIYVFDNRGRILVGPLWYVHLQLVDELTPQRAVDEAAGLGFREKGDEFDQQMLRAAARVLEEAKP